jgi:DNA-binding response OmpR family regulator
MLRRGEAMSLPWPRALVVEDAPSIRKLMRVYLEEMRFEVLEASDGQEAIRLLGTAAPALVCLDLMLPRFSGYQVCQFIRQQPALKDVPVLVVSARTLPLDRAHAEEAGASAYLTKPFTRAHFVEQVRALVPAQPDRTAP